MEVRDYLKRESDGGKKAVKQIVFEGERFDVMSVRRWRDRMIPQSRVSLAKQVKQETDSTIRQSFLAQLVTAQTDDVARDLLSELAIDDPDDTIRSFAVTKLAELWPDDETYVKSSTRL